MISYTGLLLFTSDMEQCMMCPHDKYTNLEKTHCLQRAVSFLTYEDPLGMALGCTSLSFSAITMLVLVTFVKYKDTPIVKANNQPHSQLHPAYLSSLLLSMLIALHWTSQPGHLHPAADHIWSIFHSGYFYSVGQNNNCGHGFQSHYSRKKDERDADDRGT